jgi:hypothetical protein
MDKEIEDQGFQFRLWCRIMVFVLGLMLICATPFLLGGCVSFPLFSGQPDTDSQGHP